eukprot:TRINITY_DN18838_c0_g1_i1.p1 TRINITY_DN18838_c0_g1~~TRINITY_DN18838_c0_g1_i1.p1  ORF type:complete len:1006 (+),score=258.20 TRINITY_DN18838_c0_g1_i1:102-3119(+)
MRRDKSMDDKPLLLMMDRTMTEDRIRVLGKARTLHSPTYDERPILENAGEGEDELMCPGSGCFGDPQQAALDGLNFRHFRSFTDAISDEKFDAFHIYEHETSEDINGKNLLEISIAKSPGGSDRFVEALLLMPGGPRGDDINELLESSPLHQVVRKGDPGLLSLFLEAGFPLDVNIPDGEGLSPLHAILESLEEVEDSKKRSSYIRCMEILLNGEHIEPNAEDLRGNLTPLHYAANVGLEEPIRLLLERGANPNIPYEEGGKETILDVIRGKIQGFDLDDYLHSIKSRPLKNRLFEFVENGDMRGLESVKTEASELWNSDNGGLTLLQMACVKGHDKVVRWLLTTAGADPNKTSGGEPRAPILIAAHHGYYRILRIFRDEEPRSEFTAIEPISGKTVLHEVFRQDSAKFIGRGGGGVRGSNYRKCFDVLLSDKASSQFKAQIDSIINYRESLDGDTPLHYATMQTDQDLIRAFLRRGANMGIKNKKDRTAVQCILPQTLQTFFDEDCVSWDGIITDEKFKLTFLYDFLAPPKLNNPSLEYMEDREKSSGSSDLQGRPLPETEPLWYMSMASKEHRMLLKHPVIASFLWLKWQRIRSYFYINLFLYLTFVVLLTAFIFLQYGGSIVPRNPTNGSTTQGVDNAVLGLQVILSVLLIILLCREVFQMCVSFKRYFFNVENILELTIIGLSVAIIFSSNETPEELMRNRHLAALCVLFTWTELLVLIGRHPRLSTNIVMFRTVIGTFLTFLLWYSLIIVAFGIAFYLMMHSNGENKFFESLSLSLLKTSAMFVGELEFSDIPFTDNALSYIVFVSFIFLIVVVLMNLLNGLAVSDTGLIREEAEVLGWLSRVELITYTESMLLGDPFYFLSNWPAIKFLKKLPHCGVCRLIYKFPFLRDLLQKVTGGTKILLFYSCLPSKRASFFPNKRGKSLFGYKRSLRIDDDSRRAPSLYVSNDVLESAKSLILEQLRRKEEEEMSKNKFQKLEMKIERLESTLIKFLSSNQALVS